MLFSYQLFNNGISRRHVEAIFTTKIIDLKQQLLDQFKTEGIISQDKTMENIKIITTGVEAVDHWNIEQNNMHQHCCFHVIIR